MTDVANVTQIKYAVAVDNSLAIFPEIVQTRGEFVQIEELGVFPAPCSDCTHVVCPPVFSCCRPAVSLWLAE